MPDSGGSGRMSPSGPRQVCPDTERPRRAALVLVATGQGTCRASGVSTSLAVRIYKQYGDGSIGVVRTEPYRLASDVWGIGFKTADTIAQAVGVPTTARSG